MMIATTAVAAVCTLTVRSVGRHHTLVWTIVLAIVVVVEPVVPMLFGAVCHYNPKPDVCLMSSLTGLVTFIIGLGLASLFCLAATLQGLRR